MALDKFDQMLTNLLGDTQRNDDLEENMVMDDLDFISSDVDQTIERNLAVFNAKNLVDHYMEKDTMTDEDWSVLNHELSANIKVTDVDRINEETLPVLSKAVNMEYDIAMEGLMGDFKEKFKHYYTKLKKGNEALKAMIEIIDEMDGYTAKSDEVEIASSALRITFNQSGKLMDFGVLNKVIDQYTRVIGKQPTELMKDLEKDPDLDVTEWLEKYFKAAIAAEDKKAKYFALTKDSLFAIRVPKIDFAGYVNPKPVKGVKMDKKYSYPVMSLKDIKAGCNGLLSQRRGMMSATADRSEALEQTLKRIDKMEKLTPRDRQVLKKKIMKGIYAGTGMNSIIDKTLDAMQKYLRENLSAYKKG